MDEKINTNHGAAARPESGARIVRSAIAVACALTLAGCAGFQHTKGLTQLKLDYPDEGIQSLKKATNIAPTDAEYKIDYLIKRDKEIEGILKGAAEFRSTGRLDKAQAEYERVLAMNPANADAKTALVALKQDARNEKIIDEGEAFLKDGKLDVALDRASIVLDDNPSNKRAQSLRDAVKDAKAEKALLQTRERASRYVLDMQVTLQFTEASIKTVFESLSKSTGLNILFDKDVKQDNKATIYVKDVSVEDAIDLILLQNQLSKRVINGNTLIVYPTSEAKSNDYEDLVIRTVQITNADIKYVSGMLKSMLKLKEVTADDRSGLLVIRDTPEKIRLAERLIAAHDVPDPEVMLEVEVLEVTGTRASNLGLKPPESIGFSVPGGNTLTLGALRGLTSNDLLVTPLTTTINFKLQDSDTKILASPRIRTRNKEKAKIMIGDRVPTITNSVTPLQTGSSVVTGNVTYQDVGLKLEVEPSVYAESDVGIKLQLEVSNIVQEFTDSQGGRSYQIGTRNATTNLRLKDGETQILGGLISDEDRNTASKIPGLGHLPVVGRLFGNNNGSSGQSEIILAITPHIVRNLATRAPDIKSIFSGTSNTLRERPILAEPLAILKIPGAISGGATTPSSSSAAGAATQPAQPAKLITAPPALPGQPATIPSPMPAQAPQSAPGAQPPLPLQPAQPGMPGQPITPAGAAAPLLGAPPPMIVRQPPASLN